MTIAAEIKTESEYVALRAICDKAAAYWEEHATHGRNGSSMSAELAAAPEYAACTNEIRGRVDQYETLRDLPARLGCYLSKDSAGRLVASVWTGLPLGYARPVGDSWTAGRFGSPMRQYYANIGGREYTGRGEGVGMYIGLEETAASKRARKESI